VKSGVKSGMKSPHLCGPCIPVRGLGLDVVAVERFERWLALYARSELALVFAEAELAHCLGRANPSQALAVAFATKEAVGKTLGTGLADFDWWEVEALPGDLGLAVQLHGRARTVAQSRGVGTLIADWCAWEGYVLVQVLALAATCEPTDT